MKKSTLFKSIAAAALFVVGIGVNAQVTGTGTMVATTASPDLQSVDYVTVGSTMTYKVTPYDWKSLSSILGSAFKWEISADGTLLKDDASAITKIGTTDYYAESSVAIQWTKTGDKTITLTEIGQVKASGDLTSCAGSPVNLTVKVLDRPNVAWGTFTDPSGCTISGGAASIPVTLGGSKSVVVKYHLVYTDLAGTATPTDNELTVNLSDYGMTGQTGNSISIPATNPGKYEVSITGIYDSVSKKSFGALADKTTAQYLGTAGTDYPAATSTKVFYLYPTPSTSPIQHIQNL